MTIDEKRDLLKKHCNNMSDCNDCALTETCISDYFNNHEIYSDEKIDELYENLKDDMINFPRDYPHMVKKLVDNEKNTVDHPSHYKTGKFECIDIMLETQGIETVKGFCIGNAFKYLYRYTNKNGLEDVKKCLWYLNKYVELTERNNDGTEDIH